MPGRINIDAFPARARLQEGFHGKCGLAGVTTPAGQDDQRSARTKHFIMDRDILKDTFHRSFLHVDATCRQDAQPVSSHYRTISINPRQQINSPGRAFTKKSLQLSGDARRHPCRGTGQSSGSVTRPRERGRGESALAGFVVEPDRSRSTGKIITRAASPPPRASTPETPKTPEDESSGSATNPRERGCTSPIYRASLLSLTVHGQRSKSPESPRGTYPGHAEVRESGFPNEK